MVLFPFLFIVLYFGICIGGGAIAGGKVGVDNPDASGTRNYDLAKQAGGNFVRHNLGTIVLSSFGIAAVISLGLSFTGIFPWCRKPAPPAIPPMPAGPPVV